MFTTNMRSGLTARFRQAGPMVYYCKQNTLPAFPAAGISGGSVTRLWKCSIPNNVASLTVQKMKLSGLRMVVNLTHKLAASWAPLCSLKEKYENTRGHEYRYESDVYWRTSRRAVPLPISQKGRQADYAYQNAHPRGSQTFLARHLSEIAHTA